MGEQLWDRSLKHHVPKSDGASSENKIFLLVLMASHNRRHLTESALRYLDEACTTARVKYHVVLADAASKDGTAREVEKGFPKVTVLDLEDDMFWAESMRVAWEEGQKIDHTHELWLNDDVALYETALEDLLDIAQQHPAGAIVSGATTDPISHQVTYGGLRHGPRWKRLSLSSVPPNGSAQRIDFANGNVLLYPASLAKGLGGFPTKFRHSMADIFFTGTAAKKGFPVFLAPRPVGTCAANPPGKRWLDSSRPLISRLKLVRRPKGLPPGEWLLVCLRFGGITGLFYWIKPLLLVLFYSRRPTDQTEQS